MRNFNTYRGARRNAARVMEPRGIRNWRNSGHSDQANAVADLGFRIKQANAARAAVGKAIAENAGVPAERLVNPALLAFYQTQPRTRPVNRIIRTLKRAVASAA